jgi:hypothetical protein
MATYKYCDHTDHDLSKGQFSRAVAVVRVRLTSEKHASTIETAKAYDTCEAHLPIFVAFVWENWSTHPRFHEIDVTQVPEAFREKKEDE